MSETIVIIGGCVLFFGFAIWMAFYSRRVAAAGDSSVGESRREAGNMARSTPEPKPPEVKEPA